ncbi:hypothetical protein BC941DRAFT_138603 [Chlamydoabsidia padenii]|nr:hypothetical protein BC941DRAFT_138603 [Chlamydoabsidia padenii]
MPLDLLPYEIFQLVCLSLGSNKQDLVECCVVCTGWHPLFMQQLYQDIHLCGPPNFKSFLTCLSNNNNMYITQRSFFIRALTIQDGDINQVDMERLPGVCPELEQLTIDGRAHWEDNNTDNDSLQPSHSTWWPCLTSACILVTDVAPTLIQHAPHLTRLTVRCMFDEALTRKIIHSLHHLKATLIQLSMDEIRISILQLELIHTTCPHLNQLRLVHPTLTKTSTLNSLSTTTTSSLQQLVLQEVVLDEVNEEEGLLVEWFAYIGNKYPILEQLEWWNKAYHGESSLGRLDTDTGLRLISQCPRLTSVRFFHLHVDPSFYHSLLSRTHNNNNTHHTPPPPLDDLGMSYSMNLGQQEQQQIRSYSLWWQRKESPLSYVPHLPCNLVNLHLSTRLCFGSFDMSLILDQCTRLESLHLDFGTLENITSETQWTPHPLKRLVMEEVNFSSLVMHMVAFRCRHLTDMDLLDCILTEQPDDDRMDKNLAQLIFPHQHFTTVKLCGIRFAHNPSLRAKSVGIYEMERQPQKEQWYYLSHHATYLSYTSIHYIRYKLPVQAIKQHSIVKPLPPRSIPLLAPPTELNALRQMQRHDGKFGRDAPCAGYLTLACRSIQHLNLENRYII